jgi:hypothetical protein
MKESELWRYFILHKEIPNIPGRCTEWWWRYDDVFMYVLEGWIGEHNR